ncbi:MAG: double zinc ribbon domain-containing protein [Burkholderiales bacterium]|jgi:ComF family protein|nr:double zinc ribbon domain-containing protein [Burkholderiales bacterium]
MPQRKLWSALLDACFPARCVSCGQQAQHGAWCRACHTALPRIEKGCVRCAAPLSASSGTLCGACLNRAPPFDATLAACRYTFPLDQLLQDFKYGHHLALAAPLAQLLIEDCQRALASPSEDSPFREAPTHIVAMPLAAARQIERGFNQAQELAHLVAAALKLPLLTDALIRAKDAPKQATLPWRERHKNVRGAFACRRDLSGCRVLLIDDVMTTGATVAAATKALRDGGAAKVFIGVAARASVTQETGVP